MTPTSVTWGNNTTILESVKEQHYLGHTSYSEEDFSPDEFKFSIVTGVNVILHNQSHFDDEGHISTPLLTPAHSSLFTRYRRAYASLLFSWGLQMPRLEILKFNGLPDYFADTSTVLNHTSVAASSNFAASVTSNDANTIRDGPPSPHLLGKRDSIIPQDGKGLDITAYCLKHEARLSPVSPADEESGTAGGATGRCDRCALVKRQLCCVICDEPVTAMYAPCLSCGCVTHQGCLRAYLASEDPEEEVDQSNEELAELDDDSELAQSTGNITVIGMQTATYGDGKKEGKKCPGGCECTCVFDAGKGAVEDWDVMMGIVERMRKLHGIAYASGESEIDNYSVRSPEFEREIGDWESVDGPVGLSSHSGYASYGYNAPHASTRPKAKPAIGFVPASKTTTGTSSPQSLTYSHIGRRLGQVRSGDWGMGMGSGLKKKNSATGSGLRGDGK